MRETSTPVRGRSIAAEKELEAFIDKFDLPNQALIRSVRRALRQRLPAANELVYDNYNFFVIGYCATERPSDCIVSIAAAANGVGLSFYRGADLPDPHKLFAWQRQTKPIHPDRIGGDAGAAGNRGSDKLCCRSGEDSAAGGRERKIDHPVDLCETEAAANREVRYSRLK